MGRAGYGDKWRTGWEQKEAGGHNDKTEIQALSIQALSIHVMLHSIFCCPLLSPSRQRLNQLGTRITIPFLGQRAICRKHAIL